MVSTVFLAKMPTHYMADETQLFVHLVFCFVGTLKHRILKKELNTHVQILKLYIILLKYVLYCYIL